MIPRYNFNFQSVGSDFDPSGQDYQESVILIAAVVAEIGPYSFIFGVIFWCARLCCECCGSSAPTEGCCCTYQNRPRFYSGCERWWVRIAYFVVVVATVAMGALGCFANDDFTGGEGRLLATLVDTASQVGQVISDVDYVSGRFRNLTAMAPFTPASLGGGDFDSALSSLRSGMRSARSKLLDEHDIVDQYSFYRELGTLIIYGWCIFVVLLGFLGVLCSRGWPACLAVFLGFFTLLLVWPLFGVHLGVSVAFGDLCRAVDDYIQVRTPCEVVNANRTLHGLPRLSCGSADVNPSAKVLDRVIPCSGTGSQNTLVSFQWELMDGVLYGMGGDGRTNSSCTPSMPCTLTIRGIYRDCISPSNFTRVGKYRLSYSDPSGLEVRGYNGLNDALYCDIATRYDDLVAAAYGFTGDCLTAGKRDLFLNYILVYKCMPLRVSVCCGNG